MFDVWADACALGQNHLTIDPIGHSVIRKLLDLSLIVKLRIKNNDSVSPVSTTF